MLHLPASSLKFPKMNPTETHNYSVMGKIRQLKLSIDRDENSMRYVSDKMKDVRSLDNFSEDNLRAFLFFKKMVSEDLECSKTKISALKASLK